MAEGKQGGAKIGVGAYPIRRNVEDTAAELTDYGNKFHRLQASLVRE
jgi:hypothetical protein